MHANVRPPTARSYRPRSVVLCVDADGTPVPLSVFHLSDAAVAALTPDRDTLVVLAPRLRDVRVPADGGGGGEVAYACVQVWAPEDLLVNGRVVSGDAGGSSLAFSAYDR